MRLAASLLRTSGSQQHLAFDPAQFGLLNFILPPPIWPLASGSHHRPARPESPAIDLAVGVVPLVGGESDQGQGAEAGDTQEVVEVTMEGSLAAAHFHICGFPCCHQTNTSAA